MYKDSMLLSSQVSVPPIIPIEEKCIYKYQSLEAQSVVQITENTTTTKRCSCFGLAINKPD